MSRVQEEQPIKRSDKPLKRKLFDDQTASEAGPSAKKISPKTSNATKDVFFLDKTEVSKVKHGVLNRYLGSWLAILSRNKYRVSGGYSYSRPQYSRIVYVDGFAGPGVYENGDYGSPALAYELALTHTGLGIFGPPIYLIFVEMHEAHGDKLLATLNGIREKHAAALNARKVHFMVIKGEFVAAMEWIISATFVFPVDSSERIFQVPERGPSCYCVPFIGSETPFMVFADPFGYNGKDMPMTLMRKIMNVSTKSELFVNLMTGSIRRFWKLDSRAMAINLLVGNDGTDASWKGSVLEGENAKEKLKIFLQHYSDSLEEGYSQGGIHTCLFEMRNQRNMLMYNLYYASPHNTGFQMMKKAMRKESIDETLFKFSVFDVKHRDFEVKKVDIEDLEEMIWKKFEGKVASGREITEFIDSDPHLDQHFRSPLKKQLGKFCISPKQVKKFDEQVYNFSK